jgi:predicted acetyltransferase
MTSIRAGRPDDYDRASALLNLVFHQSPDEESERVGRQVWEPERALVAEDGDAVVGHAAVFTREMTVPGAAVPCAHVTGVGVAPTHRRRGILTDLMHRQLRDVRERGTEPIAALWASEGRIYPRYGYGSAAPRLEVDARTVELGLPAAAEGRLRICEPAKLQPELAAIYERARSDRPGWSSRDDRWWAFILADPESRRSGAGARRAVVHEAPDGAADGYATWRVKSEWRDGNPAGEVQVDEVVATAPAAYRALWRFLLSIDLTRAVRFSFATPDEPLLHLVAEPRRLGSRYIDGLWVRVVDVAAALRARRYPAAIGAVLEVTDPLLPENAGRWRLTAQPGALPRCEPTTDPADVALDVVDLGAAYLGGTTLGGLAAAGRVHEGTPGALGALDAALRWHRAPGSAEVF